MDPEMRAVRPTLPCDVAVTGTAAMVRETLIPGTVFQSRYEIVSLLREGSIADIYEGRQLASGQLIVLKVVRLAPDGGPEDLVRRRGMVFLRAMRVCAHLQHPSIVRLIEFGRADDERVYAVFDLVPGRSLAELLAEQGALDPQEARRLMLQVLDALGCAHRHGVVHGDLRPTHVMVAPAGPRRNALVLDFGFGAFAASARADQNSALARGSEVRPGPRAYAAPEQLRGFPPTAPSDLYAWGRMFLECLTGRRAGCSTPLEAGGAQRENRGSARIPAALLEHPLGDILRRATSEDVAARAVTADDLLRELNTCQVDGLRREDLIKPDAPSETGKTEESGGDRQDAREERNRDAAPRSSRQPETMGLSGSSAAPIDELARTLTLAPVPLTQAAGEPAPGERGHGPMPAPLAAAATSAERMLDAIPPGAGSTIKHYEIIRKLGQGGMGIVYLARDPRLGRLVALKLLLRYSGRGIERFLAEARATARCRHENIVVIYDVDEIRGYPYLVLEYIKGSTLRKWMIQRERQSMTESPGPRTPPGPPVSGVVIELMIPVVRALACAHELGIVHRDLKPENIMLDDAGGTKVLDFGIAKQMEARRVATTAGARAALARGAGQRRKSALLGTPRYMSPEQLLGGGVDHRADLWAVGVMLYELLTGKHPLHPFRLARLPDIADFDVPMPSLSERRPELGALGALVDRCLKKSKDERIGSARELLAELEALLPSRKPLELGDDESPFAGLSAFQEADAARFFGRDRDVAAITARLRNQPLLAIVGPSGAGKSSFVRAGVIPALRRAEDRWEAFILRPGRRPLSALADVLEQVSEPASMTAVATASPPELSGHDRLVAALRTQPGCLGAALRARCRHEGTRHRVLLFIDQLEELYTLGAAPKERAAFLACLEGAADDASSPLRVLLAIRSDFLDRMTEDRRFINDVPRGLWLLPPMGREGQREALMRPLEAAGHRFETGEMVEDMLRILESTRSPLPLLQFTATKLWEARDRERRLLTRQSYEQLGGVAGALSAHADAVISALPTREQRLARAVFLRLVTPERTRAVVSLDELCELAQDGDDRADDGIARVVQHLASARLVLIEPGDEREGTTVELVHESLIDRWAKLRQWLDEGQQDAQFLSRLHAAAHQWEASGQADGLLWRDRTAEDARAWHERRRAVQGAEWRIGLGKREERYLLAVVTFAERARRLRRRLVTGAIAALTAIAVMVSYLAVRADQQATRAEQQATRADQEAARAQTGASKARNATRMATAREHQADPTTALAILREVEPPGTPRGWASLARSALYGGVARAMFSHPDSVLDASYSPDGKRIVTASKDNTARVWNADGTGEPLVLRGHKEMVYSAAFSPDGKRILTTSFDNTARVWNADGTGEPLVLRGHGDRFLSAAFSPDGKRIVTTSFDNTAQVWNADGAGEPLALRGHEDRFLSAAFSPDGKRIVTVSWDKPARVWNADGTGKSLVLRDHEGVLSAAFSPDGKRILTTSGGNTARVWHADGKGKPLILRGHEKWVRSAAFGPDGKRIVTASDDNTVRVWNADGKGKPLILRGHEKSVHSATFGPDGKRIVTASDDNTARVWNASGNGEPLVLRGHEGAVRSAVFSPDGKRILIASGDKAARVWDADVDGEPAALRGHTDVVWSAAFSPDGARIVTASADNTARVWNVDGNGEPLVLRGHEGAVRSAAFSPDGKRIVTASHDNTARVWNADGNGEPLVLRGHTNSVLSAAFSPDGKRVVTASDDKTVRIWKIYGNGEPLILRSPTDAFLSEATFSPDGKRIAIHSIIESMIAGDLAVQVRNADATGEPMVLRGEKHAFSPDGKRIATVSIDCTVRIWEADGMGEPMVLPGCSSAIAFSPDGRRIATASADSTVRVWDTDSTGEPRVLPGSDSLVIAMAFSHDGKRIATVSDDSTVRVCNVDGTGEPLVLPGSESTVLAVAFSPDGERIATASGGTVIESGKVVSVWTDLEPLHGVDDPRLWTATTYCMPIDRRIEILGVDESTARTDREACLRHVEGARASAPGQRPESNGYPSDSADQ
ncbi:nSTAND1 domain-containing NTPase [Sorangium sp. So ce1335]|uniref:nSTAND1 domain-containing NTPase n=1 Tax=Sorangium sp. So ce1335 TaxID=3133335 RepID=UPI003F631E0C